MSLSAPPPPTGPSTSVSLEPGRWGSGLPSRPANRSCRPAALGRPTAPTELFSWLRRWFLTLPGHALMAPDGDCRNHGALFILHVNWSWHVVPRGHLLGNPAHAPASLALHYDQNSENVS